MINSFIFGLENKVLRSIFLDLQKNVNFKIISSITTKKDFKFHNVFIEKNLYRLKIPNYPSDSTAIEIFKNNKVILEQLLTRVSIKKKSKNETKNFYTYYIYFFLTYFKKNQINFVFFDSTPHFPLQYIIYLVSKYLKIKILILHRTDISNYYLLKRGIEPINIIKTDINTKNSLKIINNYFDINKNSIWKKRSIILNNRSLNKNHSNKLLEIMVLFELSIKTIFIEIFFIKNTESIFFYNKISFLKKIFYKINFILKYQDINKYLDKISVKPNFDKKFIFFGLHFQPERSTLPEGGKFYDQYKAIKILSQSVDTGTLIYVKEHPRQIDLYPDLRRLNSRNIFFYKKILQLKNVYIVRTSFSSDYLLKNSHINSTITGSIGSDSLKFKRPVILFSPSWYSDSSLCKVVNSIDTCKKAIKYFSNKYSLSDHSFRKKLSNYIINTNVNSYNKSINRKKLLFVIKKFLRLPK